MLLVLMTLLFTHELLDELTHERVGRVRFTPYHNRVSLLEKQLETLGSWGSDMTRALVELAIDFHGIRFPIDTMNVKKSCFLTFQPLLEAIRVLQ